MAKLAIIVTHPIQYYAPVFQLLHKRGHIEIKVFYTLGATADKFDPDFGRVIEWDIPLISDYPFCFLPNVSFNPGSHHFSGIKNPTIIQEIFQFSPSAILVYGWAYSSHLKLLRFFKNKLPIYFRGDSNLIDRSAGIMANLKFFVRKTFLKWVYSHVDYAFYVGSANKKYYEHIGLKNNQLWFAPHAIDNDRFCEKRAAEVSALRTNLGLSEKGILILFAGKIEPKKSPLLLFEAFEQLEASDIHLLFVGNGSLESTLQIKLLNYEQQKKSNLSNKVHWHMFKNQSTMPVYYQACDLFCLPSQGPGETWGLAVNEAMACSKAILVSDKVGCAQNLVIDGVNGKTFASNNLNDLIYKLKALIHSREYLKQLGSESFKIIMQWTFQEQCRRIENTIIDGA